MTVAELKAILDTLPDDMEVLANHERHGDYEPALFQTDGFSVQTGLGKHKVPPALIILPMEGKRFKKAQERTHWKQLTTQ